ncbi:helix-turn-helix domain-containing protein [Herbidospora sp. RD11066]
MITRPMTFTEIFDLPLAVDLPTAARALGICRGTAYRLIHSGAFPCVVIRVGRHYRVPTACLITALGIDQIPVDADDLKTGAEYAAREVEETP